MSFETPTPPPPSAPQAGPSINFNVRALSLFDKIALGAGALFFIFSFFSAYVVVSGGGYSANVGSAWHSWATLGVLLTLAAIVLIALKAVQPSILPANIPWAMVTAGAAGLGWILLLLRGLTWPDPCSSAFGGSCSGISVGIGWSGWVLLIIGLVVVAAAVIPLTSAAGNVEAKLRDAAGKVGNSGGPSA